MKILIHGRKNGYTVLYPRPTPTEFYSFASDIQSINANNYDVYYGKNFYTLAFVDGGCVFTKYVIGDDVERGQLGEIGISVFIPNTQKLSGADVKTLLDELINTYNKNYISNNKIDEPKNGFDWLLFASLANGYDAKLLSRSSIFNNVTIGKQDPAFHYYKSDSELIEHLDKPFQEEYSDYKQILFIDNNLQGASNPLNVLKNSGVEVNPDLKNEYYYLNNYNRSRGVTITANGKPRSDKKGENQIRAKWQVEIKYSKDDRCYEPINVHGTISDSSSEIYKYLEVKGNHIMLNYDAFNPTPKTKSVTFKINDRKGNDIYDAEITCKNSYQPAKTVTNNHIVFSGEELKESWSIIVHKGDFSGKTEFTPDKTNESVEIIVEERNIITINVKDEEGKYLSGFEVWTKLTDGYKRSNTIEFVDEQIIDIYHITVRKEGFEDKNIHGFRPYRQNSIDVTLKKKQETTKTYSEQYSTNFENKEQKSFVAKAKTLFSKPAVKAISIVSALVLGIGIWALCYFLGNDKQPKEIPLNKWKIEMYVEGDSLMLDKLNVYKKNWNKQEQNFITKSGGGLFGGEEKADSTKWKSDWKPAYESIDRAIKKRELINNKNIAELRNQHYSYGQLSFKTAIEKINSTKYAEVEQKLGDLSTLTLTQIAGKINEILTPKEPLKDEQQQEVKKEEKKVEQKKDNPLNPTEKKQSIPTANHASTQQQSAIQSQSAITNKTSEIIQYIKGFEVKKDTLNQYLKDVGKNTTLQKSIKLCLKLWSLDGTRSNSFSSYLGELKKDTILKNSKLKDFVDEMCSKEKPKYIIVLPAIDQSKSLSQIKSLVQ
jgi:hypothetical protein